MQNVHFTPPKLSKLFGVNESTVKRWIDKGYLKAERSPGGHRKVSQQQLNDFIEKFPKYRPKSYVITKLLEEIETNGVDWKTYYNYLLNNDTEASQKYIHHLFLKRVTLLDQLEQVIHPTLVNIGLEWERGNISIYQEHAMSFMVRQQLVAFKEMYPPKKSNKKKAILACVPGDRHEIILQMLEVLLFQAGWSVWNLGINISLEQVQKAIDEVEPDIVCVSNIAAGNKHRYLNELLGYSSELGVTVYAGGSGWRKQPEPAKGLHFTNSLKDFSAAV